MVVFMYQSKLHMEGFRSLKVGEAGGFTFKKSTKGLESIRFTSPAGVFCIGSERESQRKEHAEAQIKARQVLQLWRSRSSCQQMQVPP